MPELPEVQTIIDGLNKKILNKKIESLVELRSGTVQYYSGGDQTKLGSVTSVRRKGKYIILETSNALKLVIHLRMSGKLIFDTSSRSLPAHARAFFIFSDKTRLIFDDVRAFGKIGVYKKNFSVPALEKLGPDPFVDKDKFTPQYLRSILKNRRAPIKNILLNQKFVAGIGNIYACEILFRAKISPTVPGRKLSKEKIQKLHTQILEVLQKATRFNGTTISDYRNIDDKSGGFQKLLKIYQKEHCECGAKINKIKQAGRSTYFCDKCQPAGKLSNELSKEQQNSKLDGTKL